MRTGMLRMAAAFRRAFSNVVASDPYFDNVVSLFHFDGSLNDLKGNTWTTVGNVSPTGAAKFGSNGATFDGDGDRLTIGETPGLYLDKDFTVEGWINLTSYPSVVAVVMQTPWSGAGFGGWTVWVHQPAAANKLSFWLDNFSAVGPLLTSTSNVPLGTYMHFAVTRSGNVWRMFINGVKESEATSSASITKHLRSIGGYIDSGMNPIISTYNWLGTMDELRVTNGIARYVTDFTPPALAFPNTKDEVYDPFFDNVVSLLHFDGNLTDVKGKTWTANGGILTNGVAKFGTNSLSSAGGDTEHLSSADHVDWTFGSGDWTVEMWARPNSVGKSNHSVIMYSTSNANSNPPSVGIIMAPGSYEYRYGIGNSSLGFEVNAVAFGTGSQNTWSHLAIVRLGTKIYAFHNGVLGHTYTIGTTVLRDPTAFILGGGNFTNCGFDGEIDEFRVTKGVARYVANFTPPTAAFSNIQNPNHDIYIGSVVSLLNFDNGFTDSMGETWTSYANATISNSEMILDGTGDYIECTSDLAAFGSNDWTVEAFITLTGENVNKYLFDFRNNANGDIPSLFINDSRKVSFFTASGTISLYGATSLTIGQQYHIAYSKTGTHLRIFVDGILDGTLVDSRSYSIGGDRPLVGSNGFPSNSDNFQGKFGGIRITNGVARYVTNFTPPTSFPTQ